MVVIHVLLAQFANLVLGNIGLVILAGESLKVSATLDMTLSNPSIAESVSIYRRTSMQPVLQCSGGVNQLA